MSMSGNRFDELMEQADLLEDGPAKLALLEEAIREADAAGDIQDAFQARRELIHVATFSGYPEKLLVAFAWCLAQADRAPDKFGGPDLLWEYKWVLGYLTCFPQIPSVKILEMHDDFEARLRRQDYSLRPVNSLRCLGLMEMGRIEEARGWLKRWQSAPRDVLTDCRACDLNNFIEFLIVSGQDEEALREAEPLLRGRLACGCVPHLTLSRVLAPLVRLGRREEADECHRRGYRKVSRNRYFVRPVAEHLLYRLHTGDLAGGVRLVERHVGWAAETSDLDNRFRFYLATALLFERLAAAGRRRTRKVRLPRDLPCRREDDAYAPAELAEWFHAQAADLAGRFNQRNGNDDYIRRIDEARRFAGM